MKKQAAKAPVMYTLILYICSLVLFLEWLYPVGIITDTGHISVFILYTLFCFLISALNVYWWLSFLAKGAGMLFVVNALFFNASVLQLEWLKVLWTDLSNNMTFLIHQDWYQITPIFRSILFLVLIWLMSYLLYYWFVTMKYVFVFVALTIIYVSLLDTFTMYNAQIAIIRIVIVSLISLGLTNLMREHAREGLYFPKSNKRLSWTMPIIVITLLSVGLGYFAPKFGPQWPDPVPFIESVTDKSGDFSFGSSGRTVGYGEDDSELGGSFAQDDTPVFQAEATEKQYWRIETKDVYTGKGWERSAEPSLDEQEDGIALKTFEGNEVETDTHVADITFNGDVELEKLVYPYGISDVQADSDSEYWLDESSESIHTRWKGDISLSSYTITYEQPSFDLEALKNASEDDPEEIREQYTQLPNELPERVGELAEDVTDSFSNRYNKAKAIEQYFGRSGFVYQISDVPVPDADQDYVDQFLYDTQAGYCDNYSTSMVVMLRAIDIPARWVKGFTGGEVLDEKEDSDGDNRDIYEITNSNAHSWVEVYFPDIGWVPFEPTQGFTNEADFYEESDEIDDDILDPSEQELNDPQSDFEEEEPDNETEVEPDKEKEESVNEKGESNFSYWYLLILIPIIGLVWYVYHKRYHIKVFTLRKKLMRNKGDAEIYGQAYLFLLRLFKHKGLEKGPEQTLREFASRIDQRFRGNDMKRLTAYYEEMVYNKQISHVDDDFYELWNRLVEHILKDG